MQLIDGLKGIACLMIVWHHLAFYGPMSDAARPLAPGLIDWLYEYARMAVQVFLVIGGYLAAASLAPDGRRRAEHPQGRAGTLLLKRYQRLAIPCAMALTLAVASAEVARRLMTHESISAPPTFGQLVAHLLLLQHLLDFEALSAGIWYVAIDFQLYALAIALFSLGAWIERRTGSGRRGLWTRALVVLTAAASLFVFNLDERLDDTALYFAGSYGLGMLSWWASRSGHPRIWLLALVLFGLAALMFEFRERIAIALATAVLLGWGQTASRAPGWALPAWLSWTGLRSYSIFLVHFPVCLMVNAVVSKVWPEHAVAGAFGMLAAFALSIGVAAPFYRLVEARPLKPFPELRFHAALLLTGLAAMLAGALASG